MEVKKFLKLNNPNDQIKEMSSTKMQKETEVLKSAKRYKNIHNQSTLSDFTSGKKSCTSQGNY